jgi:peroxiredoxin
MANRISYLIDENGVISKSFDKVVPADHADELLQLLEA